MNDLEAPYRKIKAAEEQIEYNFLLNVYAEGFRRKFFGPPVYPTNNSHFTTIKDIKKACGDRAMEIIQHYFEMPDPVGWFSKQGYSLHELHRSLNRVNASFHKKQGPKNTGTGVLEKFYCDACWEPFSLTHPMTFEHRQLIRCEKCTTENKPRKIATPQEKLKAVMGLAKLPTLKYNDDSLAPNDDVLSSDTEPLG